MPRPLPGSDYFIGKGLPGENVGIEDEKLSIRGFILTTAEEALLRQLLAAYTNQVEHGTSATNAALSAYLTIPALRGLWPGSSFDQTGTLYDVSGQARHMTATGSQIPDPYYTGRTAYVHLSRRNAEAFQLANNAALSPTTALSFGLWLRLDGGALPCTLFGKMNAGDYAYGLSLHANAGETATIRFYHSPDGTTLNYNETTMENLAWRHVAATFHPDNGPALYVDGQRTVTASGLTTSLNVNAAPLTIGYSQFQSINTLDGSIALAFLAGFPLHQDHVADLYQVTRCLFGV